MLPLLMDRCRKGGGQKIGSQEYFLGNGDAWVDDSGKPVMVEQESVQDQEAYEWIVPREADVTGKDDNRNRMEPVLSPCEAAPIETEGFNAASGLIKALLVSALIWLAIGLMLP